MSGVRGRFANFLNYVENPDITGVKGLWRRTTQRYVKTATVTMARADTISKCGRGHDFLLNTWNERF